MYIYDLYLPKFFLEQEVLADNSCKENQNTHSMFSKPFPQKSCPLWDNVEKYGTARQPRDDNIMLCRKYFICMPDN